MTKIIGTPAQADCVFKLPSQYREGVSVVATAASNGLTTDAYFSYDSLEGDSPALVFRMSYFSKTDWPKLAQETYPLADLVLNGLDHDAPRPYNIHSLKHARRLARRFIDAGCTSVSLQLLKAAILAPYASFEQLQNLSDTWWLSAAADERLETLTSIITHAEPLKILSRLASDLDFAVELIHFHTSNSDPDATIDSLSVLTNGLTYRDILTEEVWIALESDEDYDVVDYIATTFHNPGHSKWLREVPHRDLGRLLGVDWGGLDPEYCPAVLEFSRAQKRHLESYTDSSRAVDLFRNSCNSALAHTPIKKWREELKRALLSLRPAAEASILFDVRDPLHSPEGFALRALIQKMGMVGAAAIYSEFLEQRASIGALVTYVNSLESLGGVAPSFFIAVHDGGG